jgi:DNA-binding NarL/FixJ family response regulator
MLKPAAPAPITTLGEVRPESGASPFPLQQHVLDAHQALLTCFCVARGCENEADPHSSFCSSCREKLARGETLLYPLAAAMTPSGQRQRMTKRQLAQAREHLTARELEVLSAAGEGSNTSAIAKALAISTHTVTRHRRNLLAVLGAKNTAHAFAIAYRRGLVV